MEFASWFRGVRRQPAVSVDAAGSGISAPENTTSSLPEQVSTGVVLVVRQGCHLCQVAQPVVADACAQRGRQVSLVDVDSDADLARRYTAHVPVLFVDGLLVDYWQVDPDRLARALDRLPVPPVAPLES